MRVRVNLVDQANRRTVAKEYSLTYQETSMMMEELDFEMMSKERFSRLREIIQIGMYRF
jgi:hypothetical protein